MNLAEDRVAKKVLSLNLDLISYENALTKIISLSKSRTPSYVCFANVHMAIEAYENEKFAEQVNGASLILSDGVPLVKYINYFYQCEQERIAGMDLFPDLIRMAELNSLNVFFFGTTSEVLEKIRTKIEKEHPRVNIVGLLSPPFNKHLNDESYINSIQSSGANLVFVALGCPKQEQWMSIHSSKINAVLLGVGGAFPVFAGLTNRAPKAMQITGTEWLYRLKQEPIRLFKRYFRTNIKFLFLLVRDIFSAK